MPPELSFMIEGAIVNSAPIFLAAMAIAYIAGPFLKNVGANKYVRIAVYSIVGVACGMWSYSSFDAPDRNIEFLEATLLIIGMVIYSFLVIAPIVLIKNRITNGVKSCNHVCVFARPRSHVCPHGASYSLPERKAMILPQLAPYSEH